jgi:hypothetical protein
MNMISPEIILVILSLILLALFPSLVSFCSKQRDLSYKVGETYYIESLRGTYIGTLSELSMDYVSLRDARQINDPKLFKGICEMSLFVEGTERIAVSRASIKVIKVYDKKFLQEHANEN